MTAAPRARLPWWIRVADAATLALVALAWIVQVTGGFRHAIAGIVVSIRRPSRLIALAFLVCVARHVAFRVPSLWQRAVEFVHRARQLGWIPEEDAEASAARAATRAARSPWIVWLLGACLLFYVVNNGIWLLTDASSPSYDKAAHAGFALKYLRLFQDPVRLSLAKLLEVTQYWPPFFHVCSVPFTMVLGFSVASVASTNFLFLLVAVFSTYRIGQRLFDQWVGIGAVALTLLYPMVYALSREVLVDFALIAMVTLSLDLILASDAGLNRRRSLLLGAAIGCAMLTKWTVVTFLIGPAILWFATCARRQRPPVGPVLASLGVSAFVFAIVAGPWYVTSLGPILKGAAVAFGSDPAQEGDPTRVIDSLRWYWSAVGDALIMKPLLIATAVGLAAFAARVRSWTAWAFLLGWIVPAMVLFVLIPNKDGRFVVPLLPAIAIMTAAGIRALPWRAVRGASWVFIVTAGLFQFYAISFGWPVTIRHSYTHPPQQRDWKVNEILTAIASIESTRPLRVAVLPDDPDFEQNLFQLAAAVRRLPMRIDGFGGRAEPVEALRRYDVLISKTGSIAVEYTARHRVKFRDDLDDWIKRENRSPQVTLWRTWPLPDRSRAQVYVIR